MSKHSPLSSSRDKPVCPGCNSAFSVRDMSHLLGPRTKCPMILECGHTVCLVCLRAVSRLQKAYRCPVCQQDTEIPDNRNWRHFPANYHILGFLFASKMNDADASFALKLVPCNKTKKTVPAIASETDVCAECSKSNVSFECVECERLLCKKCYKETHGSTSLLRGHLVRPVLSVANHPLQFCKDHDKLKDFYCNDDDEVICPNCALVGVHKGHEVVPISDKNKTCLGDIETALGNARKVRKCLKYSKKVLKELLIDAEKETRLSAASIRMQFLSLHAALQLREHALIDELGTNANKQSETVQGMLENLEKSFCYLQAVIIDAEAQLENPSKLVNPDWLENLTCIEDLPCFLDFSEDEQMRLMKKFAPRPVIEDTLFPVLLNCASLKEGEETDEQDEMLPLLAPLVQVPDCILDDMPDLEESSSMPDLESINDIDVVSTHSQESIASILTVNATATSREVLYRKNWHQRDSLYSKLRPQPLRELRVKPRNFSTHKQELVRVVHIKTPSEFYVHRHADTEILQRLENGIAQHCRKKKKYPNTPPTVEKGSLCLAMYEKDWYRAYVKDILGLGYNTTDASLNKTDGSDASNSTCRKNGLKDVEVEVMYIDYGNSAVIKASQLLVLPEELAKLPEMALKCTLWQIEPIDKKGWSAEAVDTFVKFVAEKKKLVEMTIMEKLDDVLHIDLGDAEQGDPPSPTPLSVRDALVFLEYGHIPCPAVNLNFNPRLPPPLNKFAVFYDYMAPSKHEHFEVLVSHIVNAENFYVQKLGECNNHLTSLMFEMKEMYSDGSSAGPLFGPSVGMPCAALYSDGLWYRAEITALKGGKAIEVFYVDYGNRETLSYTRVKRLHKNFMKLSKMALHCKLADIKLKAQDDKDDGSFKEACEFFSKEVFMKILNLVIEDAKDKPLSVSLYRVDEGEEGHQEVCLNAEMVNRGYAVSTGPCSNKPCVRTLKVTRKLSEEDVSEKDVQKSNWSQTEQDDKPEYNAEVHISHIESPVSIFVQLTKREESLKSLMVALQQTYNHSKADPKDEWIADDLCIALNPNDKCWYRAKIKNTASDTREVFFLDYGETKTVSEENIRKPLDKFMVEPAFAFHCRLTGIIASGGSDKWPSIAVDHLQELSTKYDPVYLKRVGPTADGVLPVTLYAEEVTLASALEPTVTTYISFADQLVDQGLALPTERRPLKSKPSVPIQDRIPEEKNEISQEADIDSGSSISEVSLDSNCALTPNRSKKWKPVQFTAVAGYKFKAIPTYVNYGGSICLHDINTGATLLQFIQTTLKDKFEGTVPQSHDLYWFKGYPCIAQFHVDSGWYRAEVLEVKTNEIKVLFIDYGNEDVVRPDQLRKDVILTDIASQGIFCDLYNIEPVSEDGKWSTKGLDFLHKLIVETVCEVTVMVPARDDANMKISLNVLPDASVEKTVVEVGYARYVPKDEQEPDVYIIREVNEAEIRSYLELPLPPVEELFQVSITEITGPNTFYIQRLKSENCQGKYQTEINEHCGLLMGYTELMNTCAETWPTIENPRTGQPCCACYAKNSWFRAIVTGVDEEKATIGVFYIDYGNKEFIASDKIRELPEDLLKLPKQAILCKLHQVAPVDSWTPEIEEKMKCIYEITDGSLYVHVRDFGNPVPVDLLNMEDGLLTPSTELAYQPLIDANLIRLVREKTWEELM